LLVSTSNVCGCPPYKFHEKNKGLHDGAIHVFGEVRDSNLTDINDN